MVVAEEVFLVVEDKVYFCLSPCAGCKPDRGMMYPAANTRACSRDFQTATASMARKRHFASGARGFSGFCLSRRHSARGGRFLSFLLAQRNGVIPVFQS